MFGNLPGKVVSTRERLLGSKKFLFVLLPVLLIVFIPVVLVVYLMIFPQEGLYVRLGNLLSKMGISYKVIPTQFIKSVSSSGEGLPAIDCENIRIYINYDEVQKSRYSYNLIGRFVRKELMYYENEGVNWYKITLKNYKDEEYDIRYQVSLPRFFWYRRTMENNSERFKGSRFSLSDKFNPPIFYWVQNGEEYLREGDYLTVSIVTQMKPSEALVNKYTLNEELLKSFVDRVIAFNCM